MNLDRVIAVRNAKTIYRDGDQCVKVFNENYSKADILNEALNQARIEGIGLHVPKILGVTMIEGKWAILSEFIQGKTLSQDEGRSGQQVEISEYVCGSADGSAE